MFGAQKSHLVAVIYDYFMHLLCFDFSNICHLNGIQPGIVNCPMCCIDVCVGVPTKQVLKDFVKLVPHPPATEVLLH